MTTRKRILYVHNSADIYGASRSLLRLLPAIRERGYEPMVLLPEEGPLKERLEALGVSVAVDRWLSVIDRNTIRPVRLAAFILGFPVSVRNLLRLIARGGIDLVHTNTGVMPAPALAAKLARRPHVWHVRDCFHEFRALWSLYGRYITAMSSRVICVSRPIADQFPAARNVTVIHNGVPLNEFPSDLDESRTRFREKYRLGEALVVGCVGRIKFVRKGQEVLVRAAGLLKERGVEARYLIVGTTSPGNEEHLTRLQQLIHDLGLSANVLLTGELADPRPAYAAMDVFVLPSAQPEPFGGVVLEAMAMRRPVIATAVGGSLEQVVDGETGFLVPPGNADALAQKLEVLLREDGLRQRMAEAGRARLERCFSVGQMVKQIEGVYRKELNFAET
ncbi:MAG: glycosyltransferase [Verrucomicrobiales bacterium]|nr:glycosyltransferase [Verrucomicrobiales bacterium]